jgi:hypothetical protein
MCCATRGLVFWSLVSNFEDLNLQKIYAEAHKLSQLIYECLKVRMIEFNKIPLRISHLGLVLMLLDNNVCCG